MGDLKLNLDDSALSSIVSESILKLLTEENRNQLLQAAVVQILSPTKNSYTQKSPLEEAFGFAVQNFMRDYASTLLQDSEIQEKLKAVAMEAFNKFFEADRREKLIENLADAMAKAFKAERY